MADEELDEEGEGGGGEEEGAREGGDAPPADPERSIETEMKTSFMDYAMSVIVQRAIPDVRDGLKPVHRRILYSMHESGMGSKKPYKKSARVVGDVLGKYHPHGDASVYDSIVRMAQDFSLRYPMIDGQGNFGSIDGDNAAAMRYTEARMAPIAEEMTDDLDKDTVDFEPNYDGSLEAPVVLPARVPNLLVNGTTGIAVGMATNVPPHNLREICEAATLLIDNPDADVLDLMEVVHGPDFPTGGIILGRSGMAQAYKYGKGKIRVRGRTHLEDMSRDRKAIIITEIPYMVNKGRLLESIAEGVKDGRIEGIADLRDESDREGMRIVVQLKADANEDVALNQLFAHTQLEDTFGINNLVLVDRSPRQLSLKETIEQFIEHRVDVITRRTRFELARAEERAHIVEGLLKALENLDAVIELMRHSETPESAREGLVTRFELSEEQAKAILEMRLRQLTGLEEEKLKEEFEELKTLIARLKRILEDRDEVLALIKEDLDAISERFGDDRRTEISDIEIDIDVEDLIREETVVITVTRAGYVKRIPLDIYRSQRRGGKGLRGMKTKEEDVVVDLFITSTHCYLLVFTNVGKVHWIKAYTVPEGGRYAKGKHMANLVKGLEKDETVENILPVKEFTDGQYLVFATARGYVKKTPLMAYSRPRANGIRAIRMEEDDVLVDTLLARDETEFIIASKKGRAVRFSGADVRPMGRVSRGVRGIKLQGPDDRVIGLREVEADSVLLTVCANGYGKRSKVADYRKTRRGGKGVINAKITEKNGPVVSVKWVDEGDELMMTSEKGMVIRIPVDGISCMGRNTQGVRVMNLNKGDSVRAVAKIVGTREEEKLEEEAAEEARAAAEPKEELAIWDGKLEFDDDGASGAVVVRPPHTGTDGGSRAMRSRASTAGEGDDWDDDRDGIARPSLDDEDEDDVWEDADEDEDDEEWEDDDEEVEEEENGEEENGEEDDGEDG